VEHCLSLDKLKPAVLSSRRFSLQARFPTLEKDYQAHRVEKLAGKGLYTIAAQFAVDRDIRVSANLLPETSTEEVLILYICLYNLLLFPPFSSLILLSHPFLFFHVS
jgi:hypothetical protein